MEIAVIVLELVIIVYIGAYCRGGRVPRSTTQGDGGFSGGDTDGAGDGGGGGD